MYGVLLTSLIGFVNPRPKAQMSVFTDLELPVRFETWKIPHLDVWAVPGGEQ